MYTDRPRSMGGYLSPEAKAAAERARRDKKRKRAIALLVAIAALAFAAGWNPPIDRQHYFSKSSDYRPDRESGCTNSGRGCHGSEKDYRDFNAYHPDTDCGTCHEYQGVGCIPCHKPKEHECSACHDGSIPGIVDRVRLTDPYPKGHYRETSHTAMGTDMKRRMTAVAGGKASAACEDCHARSLWKAHTGVPEVDGSKYGADVGCGECHNDTRSFGLAQVESEWKRRRCEDCHTPKSSSPVHAADVASAVAGTGPLRCGSTGSGCHEDNDLHALHADAPADCSGAGEDGERPCHDLTAQASEPSSTACGGAAACHAAYRNDELSHDADAEVHAPRTRLPATDRSYHRTACGDCHRMEPDGRSLITEHELATSARPRRPDDGCRDCHNAPASANAIRDDWPERDSVDACAACHGGSGLPAAHTGGGFNVLHTVSADSAGCAGSGPGCHPSVDLSEVGTPTITANIHRDCLRCHDWRERSGNRSYDPDATTCGSGRDCHAAAGRYVPATGLHAGAGGRADGADAAHHTAGDAQYAAIATDAVSGLTPACGSCHLMALGTEHARANSEIASAPAGTLCLRCHNRDDAVAGVVKAGWPGRSGAAACAACHARSGAAPVHAEMATAHAGVMLTATGSVSGDACLGSGCHRSADLRTLHAATGCTTTGCHSRTGAIAGTIRTCGGVDPFVACHTGQPHPEHRADLTGTVGGVTYLPGANVGCFGCHFTDLADEHKAAKPGMEAGAVNECRVCHYDSSDPGSGAFSSRPDVRSAIARGDRRCVACHSSGTPYDGPDGVAAPHMRISGDATLPAGFVWSDPASDWRAAMTARTGGGHNVLTGGVLGVVDRRFPVTTFSIDATTYVWALPGNSGTTTWLRASVYGTAAVAGTESISGITVTCADCHSWGTDPAGPHGAAVRVNIDPAYSQTEYANPTPAAAQFEATGTARVICIKCHPMQRTYEPTTGPGGAPLHGLHVRHGGAYTGTPREYGEKCIDCHVRIPHAWKRPRLLVRTVVTTDGSTPDTFPYVRAGHDGLVGVRLRGFAASGDLQQDACATGGCHGSSTATGHPRPSQIPAAAYWP